MKTFLFSALLLLSGTAVMATDYQFNQNYNFNKYISEGEWTFHQNYSVQEKVALKKEKAGYKDLEGNEVYHYHFVGKDIDFYLVPDNPYYPLCFRFMSKSTELNREYRHGYRSDIDEGNGFIVLNENHIANIEIKPNAVKLKEDKVNFKRIGFTTKSWDNMMQRMNDTRRQVAACSIVRGKAKGNPYGTWPDFMKAYGLEDRYAAGHHAMTQYPGIPKYYEMMKKYYNKLLEEAKTTSFKKMMGGFKDGDYVLHCPPTYHASTEFDGLLDGYVKLKVEKKGEEVTSITVQNCFTDGNFYDKEKFFFKLTLDANGYVTLNGNKYKLVPFDGRILVCYTGTAGSFGSVGCVITPYTAEYFSDNLALNKSASFATDEMYYCTTELESAYDQKKDPYLFYNFYQKYMTALFENHK